jgi:UDP-2,3-diacylglucosamine pyrophosphatase LpxH
MGLYCKKRGFDGVICGHIHHPEIKIIDCGSRIPFESDLRYEDNLYWA